MWSVNLYDQEFEYNWQNMPFIYNLEVHIFVNVRKTMI
jgi:hypothetical protein